MREAIIVFLVIVPIMVLALVLAAWLSPEHDADPGAWHQPPTAAATAERTA